MTLSFMGSLILVTCGALLAGHALVRWARLKDAAELRSSLAIASGGVAAGLALQAKGLGGALVLLGSLALVVVGSLAQVRRRDRSLP